MTQPVTSRYLPKTYESVCPFKLLYMNTNNNSICNSPKVENNPNVERDKQIIAYLYHGIILLSNKKE